MRHASIALLAALAVCGCGSQPTLPEPAAGHTDVAAAGSEVSEHPQTETQEDSTDPLLDRTQQMLYELVNTSSGWVDGFFGTADVERGDNVSRGRLSVGTQWDQRDAFKNRVRLRAKIALPRIKRRFRLLVGRGDANDIVDGTGNDNIDTLPERFNQYEQGDWLFGLGLSPEGGLEGGWDASIGIRVATPLEPYVRSAYRWNMNIGEAWLWRVKPVVFLQSQRGPGMSLGNTLDYALEKNWLLRWYSILAAERDLDGMGWTTQVTAFQSLRREDAVAYSIFATGETQNQVPLQNYGIELKYRRQILREWFFVEWSTRLTWPREVLTEKRESNFGLGVEFEMQFGDWGRR